MLTDPMQKKHNGSMCKTIYVQEMCKLSPKTCVPVVDVKKSYDFCTKSKAAWIIKGNKTGENTYGRGCKKNEQPQVHKKKVCKGIKHGMVQMTLFTQ